MRSEIVASISKTLPYPTAQFELVSPEVAEQYLSNNKGNRNLKTAKIAQYVRDIESDSFMVTGEAIKFDWTGRLIDGQNRLNAIVTAGQPVTILVVRGLDPAVQAFLDTGTKRSGADALRMNGSTANNTVTAGAIRLIVAYQQGSLRTATSRVPEITHGELISWFNENAEVMDWVVRTSGKWRSIGIPPSALAASFYLLVQVNADLATRFFQDMADMTLQGKSDPRASLMRRMKNLHRENGSNGVTTLYCVLRTWNAWRTGEKLNHLKAANANGPLRMPEPK